MAMYIVIHIVCLVIDVFVHIIDLPVAFGKSKRLHVCFAGVMAREIAHIYGTAFTRAAGHIAELCFCFTRLIYNAPAEGAFRCMSNHYCCRSSLEILYRSAQPISPTAHAGDPKACICVYVASTFL